MQETEDEDDEGGGDEEKNRTELQRETTSVRTHIDLNAQEFLQNI